MIPDTRKAEVPKAGMAAGLGREKKEILGKDNCVEKVRAECREGAPMRTRRDEGLQCRDSVTLEYPEGKEEKTVNPGRGANSQINTQLHGFSGMCIYCCGRKKKFKSDNRESKTD